MSKERKESRGERLAKAIQWVRSGVATGLADCRLLVSEIDRLAAENIRLRDHDCEQWLTDARCCTRCSAEFRRPSDLLDKEIDRLLGENARLRETAARYAEREMRAWDNGDEIRQERDYWRRDAESKEEHQETLARENKRLERELDMARAARNVALDKLVQIARIVSPDDFEGEDA